MAMMVVRGPNVVSRVYLPSAFPDRWQHAHQWSDDARQEEVTLPGCCSRMNSCKLAILRWRMAAMPLENQPLAGDRQRLSDGGFCIRRQGVEFPQIRRLHGVHVSVVVA